MTFTLRGGFLNDLIGESCSALLSSSLENLAAVSSRHSLSEAVFLLSLTNLRLIRSKHCYTFFHMIVPGFWALLFVIGSP